MSDPPTWRESAKAGRYEEAERLRTVVVGEAVEPDDEEEGRALRILAAMQVALRGKAWRSASRRLDDVDDWPAWIDGERVQSDVTTLAESGAMLERRDVDTALATLASLNDLPPGPFEAERLTQLGTARILVGDDEHARASFEQALARDPKHVRALVNLGNVALEAGATDEAIERYLAALQIDDAFANAHHNLGVAYRRKGMIGKSVASLRRAQRAERSNDARAAREDVRSMGDRMPGRRLRWGIGSVVAAVAAWWLFAR